MQRQGVMKKIEKDAKGKKQCSKKTETPAPKKVEEQEQRFNSAMSVIRDTVRKNAEITKKEDLLKALKKAGVSCAEISMKTEWKKTLRKMKAEAQDESIRLVSQQGFPERRKGRGQGGLLQSPARDQRAGGRPRPILPGEEGAIR